MPTDTLRDRARGAVRDEVLQHAWDLFATQGFEATTVEQVADAAGMSRRTFFRYFSGKDELILAKLDEAGAQVAEALAARPADEAAWPALLAALHHLAARQDSSPDQPRRLRTLLRDEPSSNAALEQWRRRWIDLLTPLVAARLDRWTGRGQDPRPEAIAGSALACMDAAQTAWIDSDGVTLAALLDRAMSALAPTTSDPAAVEPARRPRRPRSPSAPSKAPQPTDSAKPSHG